VARAEAILAAMEKEKEKEKEVVEEDDTSEEEKVVSDVALWEALMYAALET
jgi:hypothetical protein